MPIKTSNKEIQDRANLKIIESIKSNGLRPLSSIDHSVTPNPVLQTQGIDGNICVNYINFEDATEDEQASTLETAVYEEYVGIYGITIERQWPFQKFAPSPLFSEEMYERLNNSILFMLKPPTRFKALYHPSHFRKPTTLAFYEVGQDSDGFSQIRGRNLLDLSQDKSSRITEIKTTHCFSTQEIMCIFVPEIFHEMVAAIFKETPIIKVGVCEKRFQAIPEILDRFHEHRLSTPMSLSVPDYYTALLAYTKKHKTKEFSLHVVRMQTQFDFITRKIQSVTANQSLLEKTNAMVLHQYSDDSAWITIHKNYGFSKKKFFEHLENYPAELTPTHIEKIKAAANYSMKLCDDLVKAKGEDYSLTFLYQELSRYQIIQLEKIGVQLTQQPSFYILNFPKAQNHNVDAIIKHQQQHAAKTIKVALNRFWTMKKAVSIEQDSHCSQAKYP